MIRQITRVLLIIIVKPLYWFFGVLPIEKASALGGAIGRAFGPKLRVDNVARKNIQRAFPEFTERQVEAVLYKMWDSLGRVVGEFPHMATQVGSLYHEMVEVEGLEYVRDLVGCGRSVIFFSGHFSNWEIVPKTIFENGFPDVHLVYRKSNNPYIDRLILQVRSHYQAGCMPKGSVGARKLIHAIKAGKSIGMLVDQKQNDGMAVPFFGRNAMTAPAIVNLALKYNCSLVPVQVYRTRGAKFKAKFYPPLDISAVENSDQGILQVMTTINATLEGWIREHPEQWFWVHNRWPKE